VNPPNNKTGGGRKNHHLPGRFGKRSSMGRDRLIFMVVPPQEHKLLRLQKFKIKLFNSQWQSKYDLQICMKVPMKRVAGIL
jgi:hypothetical protein